MELKELREKIYKEQFWDYDYQEGSDKAKEVLYSLENLKTNPVLLDYVFMCLRKNEIELKEYFFILVHVEHRRDVFDKIINKVFNSVDEAEDFARSGEDISDGLMFERYSIKKIGE